MNLFGPFPALFTFWTRRHLPCPKSVLSLPSREPIPAIDLFRGRGLALAVSQAVACSALFHVQISVYLTSFSSKYDIAQRKEQNSDSFGPLQYKNSRVFSPNSKWWEKDFEVCIFPPHLSQFTIIPFAFFPPRVDMLLHFRHSLNSSAIQKKSLPMISNVRQWDFLSSIRQATGKENTSNAAPFSPSA